MIVMMVVAVVIGVVMGVVMVMVVMACSCIQHPNHALTWKY